MAEWLADVMVYGLIAMFIILSLHAAFHGELGISSITGGIGLFLLDFLTVPKLIFLLLLGFVFNGVKQRFGNADSFSDSVKRESKKLREKDPWFRTQYSTMKELEKQCQNASIARKELEHNIKIRRIAEEKALIKQKAEAIDKQEPRFYFRLLP